MWSLAKPTIVNFASISSFVVIGEIFLIIGWVNYGLKLKLWIYYTKH